MQRSDKVWQGEDLVLKYIEEIRGGVPYASDQVEMMLRVLQASARPIRKFLDLGCGAGALALAIAERFPESQAVLVDFSQPMLEQAERLFSERGATATIHVQDMADAAWLEPVVAEAPFDAVVSGYAIHHLTDDRKRSLYREVFSLLSPGAAFVNVEHVASASEWGESLSDHLLIDSIHAFQVSKGSAKTWEQVRDEFVHRPDKAANILAPTGIQCEWLREAGFVHVDCFFKVLELAVFGGIRPVA